MLAKPLLMLCMGMVLLALFYFQNSDYLLSFSTTTSSSNAVSISIKRNPPPIYSHPQFEQQSYADHTDDYDDYWDGRQPTYKTPPVNQTNKFALERLLQFLDNNPRKEYPVIVGGIGDSGTRGVRSILRELGVQMLNDAQVNHQGDSMIYEEFYDIYSAKDDKWASRRARLLYKMAVHRTRLLSYNSSALTETGWEFGRQFIGAMLNKSKQASEQIRSNKNKTLGVWGMKHPRTMLLLPLIVSALEHRVRFVHVVRDPKHIVSGRNQKMFMDECHRYYGGGKQLKCPKTLEKRYQFWADTNWDIYQFARKYMSPESYIIVRTEDFVNGNVECYNRLAQFVHLDMPIPPDRMQRALDSSTPYRDRYFGLNMTSNMRREVLLALRRTTPKIDKYNRLRVKEITPMFGYSLTDFNLSSSCYDLPGI